MEREIFFQEIFGNCEGKIEIRILRGSDKPKRRYFDISEEGLKELNDYIERNKTLDCYFGVATRDGKGGKRNNIVSLPGYWVDFDFKDYPKDILRKNLKRLQRNPTLFVESGGGIHLYYLFKEPGTQSEIQHIEVGNRRLAAYLQADMTAYDATRILRVPGTFNQKYKHKPEVKVLRYNEALRYDLSDFDDLPEGPTPLVPEDRPISGASGDLRAILRDGVSEGGRNHAAAKIAGHLISKMDLSTALDMIHAWNRINRPPLPPEELTKTFISISESESRKQTPDLLGLGKPEPLEGDLITIREMVCHVPANDIFLLKPWVVDSSLVMITGEAGVGKSWFAISTIKAILQGGQLGPWESEASVPIIYLDGEMHSDDMIGRFKDIKLFDSPRSDIYLLSNERRRRTNKKPILINDPNDQERLQDVILKKNVKLVVFDNIASLAPGLDENSKQDWDPVNQWLINLRSLGVTCILVHHLGKAGTQRGTSGREDNIDISIMLKRPEGYDPSMGAKFNTYFRKSRVKQEYVEDLKAETWQLIFNEQEQAYELIIVDEVSEERDRMIFERYQAVGSCRKVADEFNVHHSTIGRIVKKQEQQKKDMDAITQSIRDELPNE